MNEKFPFVNVDDEVVVVVVVISFSFVSSWVANACPTPQMQQYKFPNFKPTSLHGFYKSTANDGKKGARFSNLCTLFTFYLITPGFRNILKCELKSISFGFTLWIMHDDWLVYYCSISNVPSWQTADEHNQVVFVIQWMKQVTTLFFFSFKRWNNVFFLFSLSFRPPRLFTTRIRNKHDFRATNSNIQSCSKRKLTLI